MTALGIFILGAMLGLFAGFVFAAMCVAAAERIKDRRHRELMQQRWGR